MVKLETLKITKAIVVIAFMAIVLSFAQVHAKSKKIQTKSAPVVVKVREPQAIDQRMFSATLWMDQIKAPITQGQVLYIDSIFAIFLPRKIMTVLDVHSQVTLQINDKSSPQGSKGTIVDYDMSTGLMLVEIKKQEIVAPKQKMSETQIVETAIRSGFVSDREKSLFISAIRKFEQNNHLRGLAGEKSFPEMLEIQMKAYADKVTQSVVKSPRKVSWSEKAQMPLPFVDSCEKDNLLAKKIRFNTTLKVSQALKCTVYTPKDRNMASELKPDYEVYTGVLSTEDPYLRVQNVVSQLSELKGQLNDSVYEAIADSKKCISHWISDRQIYAESCIERNETFKGLYNGAHIFAFYQNKQIVYNVILLKRFSDQNQKEIVEKFLAETKGSVL